MKSDNRGSRPLIIGILAGAALLALYFTILSIANSREHAWEQFLGMWFWILALTAGFGVQVGLFVYARAYMKGHSRAGAAAEMAGTGTVSTGSMVACCAHHLSDVLPVLGVSAAVMFLDKYQLFFIVLGLASNLVGITIMLAIIQKHHLHPDHGPVARILKGNMKTMRNAIIAVSLVILGVVFFTSCQSQGFTTGDGASAAATQTGDQRSGPATSLQLMPRANSENGISITVEPETIAAGQPATFRVSIDTHSGSLDFSLTGVALLKDNNGNEYRPEVWQGGSPGGHHVSGVIVFPSLKEQPQSLVLILKDVGGVPERIFRWG